jgi:hypothetical protein
MTKAENKISSGKAKKKFSLEEIAEKVQIYCGIDSKDLKGKGKDKKVMGGKKAFSLIAREYGYRGREVAGFLQKDPAVITRYLKKPESVDKAIIKILSELENHQ